MSQLNAGAGFYREVAQMKRKILFQINKEAKRAQANSLSFSERVVRLGRTVSVDEDYPTGATTNTYEVELGSGSFTHAVGDQTLTFTAFDPQVVRYAYNPWGPLIAEGTVVVLALIAKEYYIVSVLYDSVACPTS